MDDFKEKFRLLYEYAKYDLREKTHSEKWYTAMVAVASAIGEKDEMTAFLFIGFLEVCGRRDCLDTLPDDSKFAAFMSDLYCMCIGQSTLTDSMFRAKYSDYDCLIMYTAAVKYMPAAAA